MLYRFLQLDNFFLKAINAPIDASVVHFCLRGCAEGDTNLVAAVPPLLCVKVLAFHGMCTSKSSLNASGLSNCSRFEYIAHNAIDGAAAAIEIYEGS
jgi:hypothetical protein